MKNMPSKSVDIVFTSPPYNIARSAWRKGKNHLDGGTTKKGKLRGGYANYGDDLEYAEYVRWQKAVLLECWRLLSDTGAIFYNHKPRVQLGILQTPLELNPGLPLRQIIIWDRRSGINHTPRFYTSHHEYLVLFTKPDFKLKNRSVSSIGDVWSIPPESCGNPHPAPFPVELPLKALETVRDDAKVVLDPFCGSGGTGVACLATGKKFIGVDISKDYCDMARRRLYLAEQGDYKSWHLIGA